MADRPPCTAATLISAPAKKLAGPLLQVLGGCLGDSGQAFRSWDGPALGFACSSPAWREQATLERRPSTHLRWPLRGPSRTQPAPAPGPQTDGPAIVAANVVMFGTTERGLQMVHNDYASNVPPSFNTGVFLPPVSPAGSLIGVQLAVPTVPCTWRVTSGFERVEHSQLLVISTLYEPMFFEVHAKTTSGLSKRHHQGSTAGFFVAVECVIKPVHGEGRGLYLDFLADDGAPAKAACGSLSMKSRCARHRGARRRRLGHCWAVRR